MGRDPNEGGGPGGSSGAFSAQREVQYFSRPQAPRSELSLPGRKDFRVPTEFERALERLSDLRAPIRALDETP